MKLELQGSSAIALPARYDLVRTLGEGAFGSVYEVIDKRSGARVAVKQLLRAQPSALSHFKQEYRSIQDLHHPNLVGLRELFEQEGCWTIEMELVPGTDLLTWVRDPAWDHDNDNAPRFDSARLRSAFLGMAQGLIALHEHVLAITRKRGNTVKSGSGLLAAA